MKPLKERVSITLDNDLLEKIRYLAEYDDRSLSQYINLVLKKHLEELEAKKRPYTAGNPPAVFFVPYKLAFWGLNFVY